MSDQGDYSLNYQYRTDLLEHLGSLGDIVHYKKGTLVEFECTKTSHVYLILDGIIKQYFTNENGLEKTILILSKGDLFGEVTMLQRDDDRCITMAFSNTTVCKIPCTVFDAYLKSHPEMNQSIMLLLTTKIRLLMYQVFDNNYLDTKEKLYALLQRLSMQHGTKGTSEIAVPFTHEEIACMIGSTRSTVTKLIKVLTDEGKLSRNGKKFIVH